MNTQPSHKLWRYVTYIPSVYAALGLITVMISYNQNWGGAPKFTTVIAVFFCETLMVISAFAVLSYIKQSQHSIHAKKILFLNIALILTGFFTGLYLFLGL